MRQGVRIPQALRDLSEALRARHLQQRQHRHGPAQGQSHDRQLHAVRIVRHAVPERSRHGRGVPRGAPRHGRQRPYARFASRFRAARHGAQPLADGGLRSPSARPRRMRRRLLSRLPAIGLVAVARRARLRSSRRENPQRRRSDGRLLRRAGVVERPPRAPRRGHREPARNLAQPRRAADRHRLLDLPEDARRIPA